jgi:hypothetical protein
VPDHFGGGVRLMGSCGCDCRHCRMCERRAMMDCPACEGRGWRWDSWNSRLRCHACRGRGKAPAPMAVPGSDADELAVADMIYEGAPDHDRD